MTDTGGVWKSDKQNNRRDHVGVSPGDFPVPSEQDFFSWLYQTDFPVYISTHPERWTIGTISFLEAKLRDALINQVKRLVHFLSQKAVEIVLNNNRFFQRMSLSLKYLTSIWLVYGPACSIWHL